MFEKVREVICNYVEVEPENITENSHLVDDLGLSSYDLMCILGDLETEYGVTVDEAEIVNLHTVGEAIEYLRSLRK